MIWFIVALAIFVLLASMIDFSCNGWNLTKQFFTDSWWGIIAIVTGILSLVMFYGSSRSYKDLKVNETFLPNPRRLKQKYNSEERLMANESSLEVQEFDLSSITMETLVKKMAFEMTKPGPIFFKGWGNRRLELDVDRVRILGTYVEELRTTGSSLMELNADAALSYEKIEKLTKIKRNEIDERLRKSEVNLDFVNEEHKDKLRKMDLANAEQVARIRLINAQAEEIESRNIAQKLKAQGEYKLMIAKSTKDKKIARILAEGAKYYKDLTPVLKSYVIAQLGGDNTQNPSTDMDMHEELKSFVIRKQNAETRKVEYEADEVQEQTETQKEKLKRERDRYKKNGI